MKIQFKTLKMCAASGVFALVMVAQPALAQTRCLGATTRSGPSTTASQPGTPSGSDLGNYRNEKADQWIPPEIMTKRIYTIAQRVENTGQNGDEVTSNKFQDLSCELDKQVWPFRVHLQ